MDNYSKQNQYHRFNKFCYSAISKVQVPEMDYFQQTIQRTNSSAVKISTHLIWESKWQNVELKNITLMYCFCRECWVFSWKLESRMSWNVVSLNQVFYRSYASIAKDVSSFKSLHDCKHWSQNGEIPILRRIVSQLIYVLIPTLS